MSRSFRDPGLVCRVRRCSTTANAFLVTVILLIVCTVFKSSAESDVYTDQFVLHHSGGPDQARRFAREQGFVYLDRIVGDHYHLRRHSVSKRSLTPHPEHQLNQMVAKQSQVHSIRQEKLKSRAKRDFQKLSPSSKNEIKKRFDDPRWSQMWYLNRGQGLDMNVESVWDRNITGRGVVVTILDDGLEKNHPDLVSNYDPDASYDVNNQDGDPMPRYDMIDSNRHGTRCAGEVAASANNSFCAVGVAFDARIGGVRMLDGDVTDAVEARSLSLNPQHIQIYSASWGPDDDGKTVDGPGELATRAFVDGVTYGRGGLGSIFVWASGNGGREHDNCNCDGYTNSIWTLSISSGTENGLVPWYSEACSSTLATTYSSGSFGERQIVTTDLHHACTSSHTGTSASAPLAAGICALALEANRNLTWRDMQHVVVQAAHQGNLHARDWRTNGVGRNVSHSFGYGLLDADAMVLIAKDWVTVPSQKVCEVESHPIDKLIPAKSHVEMSLHVNCDNVRFLEHVQAKVTLTATRRGDIHIYLTSPSGTRSTLLAQRPMDNSRSGFQKWPFMSVHNWGENPNGEWKIEVHNEGRFYSRAYLKEWSLILYGTSVHPDRRKKKARLPTNRVVVGMRAPVKTPRPPAAPGTVRRDPDSRVPPDPFANTIEDDVISNSRNAHHSGSGYTLVHGTRAHKSEDETNGMPGQVVNRGCISSSGGECLGCANGYYLLRGRCVTLCPDGLFPFRSSRSSCLKCHYSCRTCVASNNCTSCFSDAELHRGRCYAKELVDEVVELEKWYTAVSVVFLCLCFVILVLVVYIITDKNPHLFRCTGHARASTSFLTRDRRQQTQVLKLDSKKRPPVAPIYSDDYNSEEDL